MTRRPVFVVATAVGLVLILVAGAVALQYQRQIHAILTKRKGAPSATWAWQPFPEAPTTRIAVVGDSGDSGSRLDATAAAMAVLGPPSDPYDALLLLGDNVYPSGDPAQLPATVFRPFAPVLDTGAELLAILGNHDVMGGWGDAQLAALGMEGRWWSRRFGDLLVVGLDSNEVENDEQYRFVEEALTTSSARWKVVALHHPPYSAGYQGSSLEARDRYAPLFARTGVQLVLSGHDHDYQRSIPIDGVTYVVTGGAAGTRRTGEEWFTAISFSWHHFVDLAVFDDRLVVRAVNQDGRVADEAVIGPGPTG